MFNNKKYTYAIILLLVAVLTIGCVNKYFEPPTVETLTIEKGNNVTVDYTGTFDDGTVFDTSLGKKPLTFTVGSGQLIKGFDDAVVGMKEGETTSVTLTPELAYGSYDNKLLLDVPESEFAQSNLTPEVGMSIIVSGQSAIIKSINKNNVTIDFNHPLAGKTLHFDIKIIKIE